MDLEIAAAYWSLGMLTSNKLPEIATAALLEGLDSPSLRILAGEYDPIMAEVGPLFERALRELGVLVPEPFEAGMRVAGYIGQRIISGEVSPYEGAREIWRMYNHVEAVDEHGIFKPLLKFIGAASEYEDFLSPGNEKFYGKERCEEIRQKIEADIVGYAKELIAGHKAA